MSREQGQETVSTAKWRRRILNGLGMLTAAWVISWITRPSKEMEEPSAPKAGLAAGLKHGALMPLALPRLLAGRDATIYAVSNTGRPYKIGYTAGVNLCGALFFGLSYWRFVKWRRSIATSPRETSPHGSHQNTG